MKTAVFALKTTEASGRQGKHFTVRNREKEWLELARKPQRLH